MNVLPYPAKDERNPEVLRIIKEGDYTISGLEEKFGISKFLLRKHYGVRRRAGRPKKPKPFVEPKKPPTIKPEATRSKAAPRQTFEVFFLGLLFIAAAILGLSVGGYINWHYAYSFGGADPVASFACGIISLVVDFGTWGFLPAVRPLWKQKRRALSIVAFVLMWPFLAGSTYAALGFVGVHIGDVIQARKAPATQRDLLTAQLERTVKLRNEITELGDRKMLENLMNDALGAVPRRNRDWSEDCTKRTISLDYCANYIRLKEAWTAAKARDDDDAMIASLTSQLNALPNIGSANPAAEQFAQMTGGRINPEQATNYQIRWFGIVPGFSTVLLTIGLALARRS